MYNASKVVYAGAFLIAGFAAGSGLMAAATQGPLTGELALSAPAAEKACTNTGGRVRCKHWAPAWLQGSSSGTGSLRFRADTGSGLLEQTEVRHRDVTRFRARRREDGRVVPAGQ